MSRLTIDQLPDLCLRRIFSFLNFRDLNRCRAVCRLLKLYADQTEVTKLVVNTDRENGIWYLTNRPIEFEGSISWEAFSTLNSPQSERPGEFQRFKLLQQVRFLNIWPPHRPKYYVEIMSTDFLNKFKQLVHLEINNVNWVTIQFIGHPKKLSLPNLRVLNLTHLILHPPVLNTPNLEVLLYEQIEKLEIEYPETIKKLESYSPSASVMAKFKNVEVFTCIHSMEIDPAILSNWKHLKELNIPSISSLGKSKYQVLKSSMGHILSQRTILGKEQLKIYWRDVLLLDISQLEPYDSVMEIHRYQLIHWKLLRAGSYLNVTCVNYNDLIGQIDRLSDDFFEKFPSINTVNVTGVVDRDQLEWFLKKTTNLCKLTLTNTSLDQQFLKNLPKLLNRPSTQMKITETFSVEILPTTSS